MLIVEDAAVSSPSIPAGPACLDSNSSGHDIFSEDFTLRGPRIRSVQADSNRWITTGVNGEKILFRYRDWKYMLTQAPCTRSLLDASRLEALKSDHPNLHWFYLNASAEDSALSTKIGHDDFRRHAGGVLYLWRYLRSLV